MCVTKPMPVHDWVCVPYERPFPLPSCFRALVAWGTPAWKCGNPCFNNELMPGLARCPGLSQPLCFCRRHCKYFIHSNTIAFSVDYVFQNQINMWCLTGMCWCVAAGVPGCHACVCMYEEIHVCLSVSLIPLQETCCNTIILQIIYFITPDNGKNSNPHLSFIGFCLIW